MIQHWVVSIPSSMMNMAAQEVGKLKTCVLLLAMKEAQEAENKNDIVVVIVSVLTHCHSSKGDDPGTPVSMSGMLMVERQSGRLMEEILQPLQIAVSSAYSEIRTVMHVEVNDDVDTGICEAAKRFCAARVYISDIKKKAIKKWHLIPHSPSSSISGSSTASSSSPASSVSTPPLSTASSPSKSVSFSSPALRILCQLPEGCLLVVEKGMRRLHEFTAGKSMEGLDIDDVSSLANNEENGSPRIAMPSPACHIFPRWVSPRERERGGSVKLEREVSAHGQLKRTKSFNSNSNASGSPFHLPRPTGPLKSPTKGRALLKKRSEPVRSLDVIPSPAVVRRLSFREKTKMMITKPVKCFGDFKGQLGEEEKEESRADGWPLKFVEMEDGKVTLKSPRAQEPKAKAMSLFEDANEKGEEKVEEKPEEKKVEEDVEEKRMILHEAVKSLPRMERFDDEVVKEANMDEYSDHEEDPKKEEEEGEKGAESEVEEGSLFGEWVKEGREDDDDEDDDEDAYGGQSDVEGLQRGEEPNYYDTEDGGESAEDEEEEVHVTALKGDETEEEPQDLYARPVSWGGSISGSENGSWRSRDSRRMVDVPLLQDLYAPVDHAPSPRLPSPGGRSTHSLSAAVKALCTLKEELMEDNEGGTVAHEKQVVRSNRDTVEKGDFGYDRQISISSRNSSSANLLSPRMSSMSNASASGDMRNRSSHSFDYNPAENVTSESCSSAPLSTGQCAHGSVDDDSSVCSRQSGGGNQPECRHFSLRELVDATNNFAEENMLGQGAYGPVYRGNLHGCPVAIKKLKAGSNQGSVEFKTEVDVLSRVRHPNVVLLMGQCPEEACIVYEFMAGGSLQDRLTQPNHHGFDLERSDLSPHPTTPRSPTSGALARSMSGSLSRSSTFSRSGTLGRSGRFRSGGLSPRAGADPGPPPILWHDRLRIAAEVAGGLLFLHRHDPPVLHRDLKPDNILLDSMGTSKIGDVGLACLVPEYADFVFTLKVRGTVGFIDPEAMMTGELSVKSDIYSFGLVILMLMTGYKSPKPIHKMLDECVPPGASYRNVEKAVDVFVEVLDPTAGRWPIHLAARVLRAAIECVERDGDMRPDLGREVYPELAAVAEEAEEEKMDRMQDVEKSFICPLSEEIMQDPVVAADGFTYERKCIELWLSINDISPSTGELLPHKSLTPNHVLQSVMNMTMNGGL